jgi:AcrR family transcriptional regulator
MTGAVQPRRSQAERREEAESGLLRVATKLIAQRGYDGFTLADLGAAAGYSRGLPAHYFGKKDELLSRVADFIVGNYKTSVARMPFQEPGLPRLEALIRHHGRAQGRTTRAFAILVAEALIRPALAKTIAALTNQSLADIKSEIVAGVEQGNIRIDADAELEARLIYAFIRGQMSFAAQERGFDTAAIAEAFVLALRGHLSPRNNP